MSRITGQFYLKQTRNGNLTGEFSNDHSDEISTESCDLNGSNNDYVGKYRSTWQEEGNPHFADLDISHKYTGNTKLFSLKWIVNGGNDNFEGEGMLCDDILIGSYQSVKK